MLFQKKVDRAMNWLKEQGQNSSGEINNNVDRNPMNIQDEINEFEYQKLDEFQYTEKYQYSEIEKRDIPALIISALLIFVPAVILVLGLIVVIAFLFF